MKAYSDFVYKLLRPFHHADFDECSLEPSPCHENADCTNTDGSYDCTCKQGFTGNGSICKGVPMRKTIHCAHPNQAHFIQIISRLHETQHHFHRYRYRLFRLK